MSINVEILNYEDIYHEDFKRLSYEWLVKYDLLEPEDEKIINNPRKVILDEGGFIFMARVDGQIVGTASLVKMNEELYLKYNFIDVPSDNDKYITADSKMELLL